MGIEDLQRNFEGYLNTPLLWSGAEVYNLKQCVLEDSIAQRFSKKMANYLRLGKLVERFVCHQLLGVPFCDILAENIQIQDGKRTIGELDVLLTLKDCPIHLEVIYKFYLYDPEEGNNELSHWIGPNKKDSLLEKLDKLKNRQLPLLYHPKTEPLLTYLKIKRDDIKQQVLFKGQLYLPLHYQKPVFVTLNLECVQGFYVKKNDLHQFKNAQFYIPDKINWLMAVDNYVNWSNYDDFTTEVEGWLDRKMSPLCWLKETDLKRKFFVVWW